MAQEPKQFQPVRGWGIISRSAFEVTHAGHHYIVTVDFFDFDEKIMLYRDGMLLKQQKHRAKFKIGKDAVIEARMTLLGMRYVRLITGGKTKHLKPVDGTAEAWRMRMARQYPTASRIADVASWTILIIALVTQVPELLALIGGWFDVDIPFAFKLPTVVNGVIAVAGIAAATDRALRLKYNPWLD